MKTPLVFLKHVSLLTIDAVTMVIVKWRRIEKSDNNLNKTIVFIRLDAIGDFLVLLPYLKELKKYYLNSDDSLILVGNAQWKELGEYFLKDTFARFIWINRNSTRTIYITELK